MKSIGGYFELVCDKKPLYYQDGIYLNICRNALRYIIRALGIKRIHIPFFTCHVVDEAIQSEGCKILKYNLDKNLLPEQDFPREDFIVYNNYFGVLGQNVETLSQIYPNLIVDNAQAFYSKPNCRAVIYSPRKFFGLPDGGILRGKDIPLLNLQIGTSTSVISHLLKRLESGAEAGYEDFVINDSKLDSYPVQSMSKLTRALMGNIDYEGAKEKRLSNFAFLRQHLKTDFPILMSMDDVPLVYPLLIENGSELRNKLIRNKIFCARYWPNVLDNCKVQSLEYHLAKNIVSLPIDQRYGEGDMSRIISIINQY